MRCRPSRAGLAVGPRLSNPLTSETKMKLQKLTLVAVLVLSTTISGAASISLVCENWHPRLGQVDDRTFSIDVEQQTCNGQKCKVSDEEFRWNEQGDRYEYLINRKTGEGYIYFSSSSEKTAILKGCRPSAK